MKKIIAAIILTASLTSGTSTASNTPYRSCSGCRCKVECWRNGVCRTVCRDSCGRFCFASGICAVWKESWF